ncbi:dihydroneopterin aldolase [Hyalangium versicolor]|uniref:dihydroneopterin aldolase n=1 Tax=Hyalangium versicolor TaxID=2861190 RepID=UPI001CCB85DA|nr:dihydroneopterin aldolase [Hyalangium versicolor]
MSEPLHLPPVTDAQGRPLDIIELRGLTVDCIVGVYRRERVVAQPLRLDVALFLDTREAAADRRLAHTVHYGRLAGELRFLLEACRFELVESAAEAVCRYLLVPPTPDAPRAQVRAATVRITKPEALAGRVIPSIQVHRLAGEMHYPAEEKPFGRVDIIHEGEGYGIYRLRIRSGGLIPSQAHRMVEESEMVLGAGLLLQGRPVARGMAFRWPRGFARRYENPSPLEQTVLRVDRPRFVASEGMIEETPEAELLPAQGQSYYPPDEHAVPGGIDKEQG